MMPFITRPCPPERWPIFSPNLRRGPCTLRYRASGLVPLLRPDEFPDLEVVGWVCLDACLDESMPAELGAADGVDGVVDDVEAVDELGHFFVYLAVVGAPLDGDDVLEVGHFEEGVGVDAPALEPVGCGRP